MANDFIQMIINAIRNSCKLNHDMNGDGCYNCDNERECIELQKKATDRIIAELIKVFPQWNSEWKSESYYLDRNAVRYGYEMAIKEIKQKLEEK